MKRSVDYLQHPSQVSYLNGQHISTDLFKDQLSGAQACFQTCGNNNASRDNPAWQANQV